MVSAEALVSIGAPVASGATVLNGGGEVPKEFIVGSTGKRQHLKADATVLGGPVGDEVRRQGADRYRALPSARVRI